jgi:hypothetical protein
MKKLSSLGCSLVLVAMAIGGVSCGSGTGYYTYYDPYLYTYYYPADIAYSSYYWTDTYAYSGYYYSDIHPQASSAPARWTVGNAIRALARGESVCPGQVTVTPKTAPAACHSSETNVRSGVTIVFTGCQLAGGGTVDGTVDVSAMQSASDESCSQSTMVTLSHTTTITNLSYKGSGGSRLVIPKQTDTGMNTFTSGQAPETLTIESDGQFQFYDSSNTLMLDQSFKGTRTYKFAGSAQSYTVDGTIDLVDNSSAGGTGVLTATGLSRTNDCCYPTGGSVSLSRMTASNTDQHTWTFGPTCAKVMQDSSSTTLPACE